MGLFSTAVIAQYGPPINIDYLIIGGGGGSQAYNSTRFTGGGGAGGFISGSTIITPGYTNLAVSVGPGGLRTFGATVADDPGNTGNNSTFLGLTAYGGGGGGDSNGGSGIFVGDGLPGGSGGGAGASRNSSNTNVATGSGGSGSIGQGYNGGNSYSKGAIDGASYVWRQGQGGGAGGNATSASLTLNSVPGPEKAWLDGFIYAGGGGLNAYTSSGSGGQTQNNTTIGTEGKNGLIKLRYSSSVALFTGGTIAISGGYVYHSFNVGTQPAFAPGVNTDYTLYYTG
jgi:hypothetical protein